MSKQETSVSLTPEKRQMLTQELTFIQTQGAESFQRIINENEDKNFFQRLCSNKLKRSITLIDNYKTSFAKLSDYRNDLFLEHYKFYMQYRVIEPIGEIFHCFHSLEEKITTSDEILFKKILGILENTGIHVFKIVQEVFYDFKSMKTDGGLSLSEKDGKRIDSVECCMYATRGKDFLWPASVILV
jgi:hypothetical protein